MSLNLATNPSPRSDVKIEDCHSLALLEHLKLLNTYLVQPSITEIVINQPKQILTESNKGWKKHKSNTITQEYCQRLSKLIATYSGQKLDAAHPILSATLPHGERVQIAIPPVTQVGKISITIRKPSKSVFTLDEYQRQGYFSKQNQVNGSQNETDAQLLAFKQDGNISAFLKLAIKLRKNIIVSGATGSGKTTFLRSLLQQVPDSERLISIENVDELQLYNTHSNTVSLFYSAGNQGVANITQKQLLEASLRMKPGRVFVAELIRGDEAFYFLRN
ncbi:P-type DNA transfer ATPase VirB11, partial [Parashewanella curva]